MNRKLISVILPVYNGENFLAQAIQSVCDQENQNFELLVIDNGSTDRTKTIAQSFPQVSYHYCATPNVSLARNEGIKQAHGEWLAFIDHDDIWPPYKLKVQLTFLTAHPEFDVSVGFQKICLEQGASKPHWMRQELFDHPHIAYIPSTLMVRKEVFTKSGDFDPAYTSCSDADWFFKIQQLGFKVAEMPEILVHRRIHASNATHNWQQFQKELLQIMKNFHIAKKSA